MSSENKNDQESLVKPSVDGNPLVKDPLLTASSAKPCGCGSMDNHNPDGTRMLPSSNSFVYAIGKVIHDFPNDSLKLEYTHATGRIPDEEKRGRTYHEVLYRVLTDRANRYIARESCYILTIEKYETYILVPRDPLDVETLVEALRPSPDPSDNDIIIGEKVRIPPPEMCRGRTNPIVIVDKIWSFNRDELIKQIPKRKGISEDQFKKTINALFNYILQIADNAGAIDEHRAINYLSVTHAEIYHTTQTMQDQNYSLIDIEVHPSKQIVPGRKLLEVVFLYESRVNRTRRRFSATVDVTGKYPSLHTPMDPEREDIRLKIEQR